ncbi:rab-GTPase-TBC domain-containing protein [Microdochium trichocladiopsis]|uniref:Rab-GTPase-TBC domain-containing protein n=1 Tax=Microdochium trichocladiopsis TaxID=1682393 RepID=A0A9P9BVY1_9PEZI|nr:rab-GTPase-TBC domain-containing protein [Microdochium trichocladiopsis]KAH7040227.1 rab-GTPase-TBC domain-containing protein [Microdochium trichocladiopsis]
MTTSPDLAATATPAASPPATLSSSTPSLVRTSSQLSAVSGSGKRGHSVRAKSRNRKIPSQPSSSASSVAASDRSLISFPSLSPETPRFERPDTPESFAGTIRSTAAMTHAISRPALVGTLTTSNSHRSTRSALFEDTPLATSKVPGALHVADDEHIERLIARHGAVSLVRQIAEDLAQRDSQITNLRRRADHRERALRKIILECGLSNLDLETRLRAVESELKTQDLATAERDGGISHMMNDAMVDSLSYSAFGISSGEDTLRVRTLSAPSDESREAKGTFRGWKDYLWGGGTSKRSSRANSVNTTGGTSNGTLSKQGARGPAERRPPLQEDLFTPPDEIAARSSSRASSIYSNTSTSRKPSTSLASMALQLVAGKANGGRDPGSVRGRSSSAGQGGTLRASSAASVKTSGSSRTAPVQSGPKALMAMRRATPAGTSALSRTQAPDRWETMSTSPPGPLAARPDSSGPVEMDTMYAPDSQPPSLTYIYNNYPGSEFLTDRFGFIYDQRRKKRQREAAQVALQMKRGSRAAEMLSGGRPGISPNLIENEADTLEEIEDATQTPSSADDTAEAGKPKKWQDYLKIATFPTELLSHTPLISASNLEVLEGAETPDPPKSPGLVTGDRGFVPVASTTAALDSEVSVQQAADVLPVTIGEDNEPVKLLLKQLSDVHDSLQRERSVRWNEFLRKVRAERRREGEAAAAAAAAAADARYSKSRVNIPEAKYADGEIIGVADLGVKGKVGQNKWNEFRKLVLAGIPVANRPKIWAECSGALFKRIPGYYEDIVARSGEDDDPAVVSQIEMDINRTLTDNIFFRKGPGVAKLNEVLRAYARRNPEVGYCQGMNLIAANLLLIMPSAEETFWILVSIIEKILPRGYYDHSLMASRADQQVLRQYVALVLPKLSEHLEYLSIELEALTFQWFLSVFTDCLSAEALFRVWDVVLCTNDGSTFLFQVALALLKLNEPQLLQCDTPSSIYTYINHQMTNHAISIDGLINASEGLRKVIRREDVEARRTRAIEAEQELIREREEANRSRRNNQNQKATSAPALVTETSASAVPSPAPSPALSRERDQSVPSLGNEAGIEPSEEDNEALATFAEATSRPTTPFEEETVFSLG